MADRIIYAHSLPGEAMDRWEWLTDHQEAVAALAAEFVAVFGLGGGGPVGRPPARHRLVGNAP